MFDQPLKLYKSYTSEDHQELQYIELGQGQPVVFLHGFGMEAAQWLPFAGPLAKSHRVIVPDLRGFGRSHLANFSRPCVLSDFASDLNALANQASLERFKMVGISMGALAALKYLELYGDSKVDSYFHIDQSPKCINDEEWNWGLFGDNQRLRLDKAKELLEELEPFLRANKTYDAIPDQLKAKMSAEFGQFFSSALSKPWHKRFVEKLCDHRVLFKKLVQTDNWPAYTHCFRAYIEQNYDLRSTLKRTRVPIDVIVGMKSEMYPPAGQLRIADYAKNSRIIPYTKSGHTPLIDQPLKLITDLKRFARKAYLKAV